MAPSRALALACALFFLTPDAHVSAMRTVRGGSSRGGGGDSSLTPAKLATMMSGSGEAAVAVRLGPDALLRETVQKVTGYPLPASVPVTSICEMAGETAARVRGDSGGGGGGGARWVFALHAEAGLAGCSVGTFLPSAAGVPASTAAACGACRRARARAPSRRRPRPVANALPCLPARPALLQPPSLSSNSTIRAR